MSGKRWFQGRQNHQRRQRSIRVRLLVTLSGLTTAVLLAVALTFNLFIHGYVWGRESDQLDAIQRVILSNRWSGVRKGQEDSFSGPGKFGRGRKFEGGQDRITGVRGSAVALDESGAVRETLNGDEDIEEELSAWFQCGQSGSVRRRPVSLDSGEYLVSVIQDREQPDLWWVCYVDVTAIRAFTRQVNLVLFGIILAAIALSVLLSRRIADSLSTPFQSLSAFAGEIGKGDFQRRSFSFQDEELCSLAEAMNRMAEALQKANRQQEIFFQNVSHELRTPLTAIRGSAEGILYGIMDPKASGAVILSEADRLGGFVEDLLYLSRLGKAAPEEAVQPLDLRDALSLCVSEQRVEAERRGVSFSFDFDEDPVLFPIRERDARQLFGNLLSNAIRYASSEVRLTCHREPGGQSADAAAAAREAAADKTTEITTNTAAAVSVTVSDDGPGIAPGDLPHIFERFYKGAGGKHGIGLSIVKSITDIYHGTIAADCKDGAAFLVRFPVS